MNDKYMSFIKVAKMLDLISTHCYTSDWMNNVMNGKEVVEKIGITYPQLRYFVRKIDALPKKETSQGHEHDFTFRDLVYLKLASIMRSDGLGLPVINDAIGLLDIYWTNAENPASAGSLLRLDYPGERDTWAWGFDRAEERFFINENGEAESDIITHVPGWIYSVADIAEELEKGDQLELNLMSKVGAVN